MKNIFYLLVFQITLAGILFFATNQVAAQQCMAIPQSQSAMGKLTFPVIVPGAGNYTIFVRMKAQDSQKNSLYLQIDDSCHAVVGDSTSVSSSNWTYVDFRDGNTGNKLSFNLSAGQHSIIITGREDGVKLDRIVLKPSGSSCIPSGKDDLCITAMTTPTKTPTPSPTRTPTPTVLPMNSPTPTLRVTQTPTPTTRLSTPIPTRTISPTRTPTSAVSSTPPPGLYSLALNLFLHGIGKAGDGINAQSIGNSNPLTISRKVSVEIYDTNNTDNPLSVKSGTLLYDRSSGSYKGTVNLGNSLQTKNYKIKVLTDGYLEEEVAGEINITRGVTANLPPLSLFTGDTDTNNILDIFDYNNILSCFGPKKKSASCLFPKTTDLDDNGRVDGVDYNLFIRELLGLNRR